MLDYGFSQVGKMMFVMLRVGIHATRTAIATKKAIDAKKAAYNGPEEGDGTEPVLDGQPIVNQMMTNPADEFGMTEAIVGSLVNTVANAAYKRSRKEVKPANPEDVNL
jgi:hypothetical protein